MEARELRIGNWVTLTGNDVMVDGIQNGCLRYGTNRYNTVGCFAPIELTPEILEKAGFVKLENYLQYGWYLLLETRCLCWCYSEYIGLEFKNGQMDEFQDELLSIPCKYLHQLQNLYFALTGTELIIEL